jgi:oleate hydratase
MYWRTMFAFENWHSALELKRYLQRFVHHVGGLPDFSALRFTRYNQYESLVVPLVDWLTARGVQFHYGVAVHNVLFDQTRAEPGSPELPPRRRAVAIELHDRSGTLTDIQLTPNDLVFITNGSLVSHSSFGSQNDPAAFDTSTGPGDCWSLWRNIAAQDPHLGDPEVFCGNPELSSWMSATVTTLDDRIPPYIQAVCRRDPFSGRTVTGGIVTVTDSNWLLSWTVNRQPQFRDQPPGTLTVWLYSLFTDRAGNYVRKPMRDCTGAEICAEWLYHLGVPTAQIDDLAARAANTVPCMMPYVTAFFMPRSNTDRPPVVPDHAENFAFIGQFAETPRDTIFTMEYAVRTAMEAVYTLLGVDRAVPEVWASAYDVRDLMNAAFRLRDNRPLKTLKLPPAEHLALKAALDKAKGTDIYLLLEQYGLVSGEDADPQIM